MMPEEIDDTEDILQEDEDSEPDEPIEEPDEIEDD